MLMALFLIGIGVAMAQTQCKALSWMSRENP